MKIAVLGTGMVGKSIAGALVSRGHEVRMGSRTAGNDESAAWRDAAGPKASTGTFADAAGFGEVVFLCVAGAHALTVLQAAGKDALAGKVVVDVANPLDFSKGFPPSLSVCNTDSLSETLQRAFPTARIVKSLNTMNTQLMVDASRVPGTDVFVAGNDATAKQVVVSLLREDFGWQSPIDLGDLSGARALEMWLPLWLRLYGALGTGDFNLKIVRR